MLLFYIRHGDPIYDPDSLTPLGHRQAEAVAKRLAQYGIDRIFASPSRRATQTAQPTAELTKREIETLDFCHEDLAWQDFSVPNEYGGRGWCFQDAATLRAFASREVQQLGGRWCEYPNFPENHFRQGVQRIDRETDALLLSLGYAHEREQGIYRAVHPTDERVALFAHQGFGIAFLSSLLDIPYPQFSAHFDMGHTGVSVISFEAVDGIVIPKALMVANDSHIYKEGLPTHYQNLLRF